MKWSELRERMRKWECYAFSAVTFLAGVVAGREITLLGRAEPVLALFGVGAMLLAFYITYLIAVVASIKEEHRKSI